MLEDLQKRDGDLTKEESELVKRDAIDIFYQNVIQLLGSNGTMLDICESLDNSGLGVNVLYNAITDDGWYDFDVKLFKYLVNNNYISWLIVYKALLSSGFVVSIFFDIVSNSTYRDLAIDLAIAIITGKVDIISLILAFF